MPAGSFWELKPSPFKACLNLLGNVLERRRLDATEWGGDGPPRLDSMEGPR